MKFKDINITSLIEAIETSSDILTEDVASANFALGIYHELKYDFSKALDCFDKSYNIFSQLLEQEAETNTTLQEKRIDCHFRIGKLLSLQNGRQPHLMETFKMRRMLDDGNAEAPLVISTNIIFSDVDSSLVYLDQGRVLINSGNYESAHDFFEKALGIRVRKYGKQAAALSLTLCAEAELRRLLGESAQALENLNKALALCYRHRDRRASRSIVLGFVGRHFMFEGDLDMAEKALRSSLSLSSSAASVGTFSDIRAAVVRHYMAEVLRDKGDFEAAMYFHHSALRCFLNDDGREVCIADELTEAEALGSLGVSLCRRSIAEGQSISEEGKSYIDIAIQSLEGVHYPDTHISVFRLRFQRALNEAIALEESGQAAEAAEAFLQLTLTFRTNAFSPFLLTAGERSLLDLIASPPHNGVSNVPSQEEVQTGSTNIIRDSEVEHKPVMVDFLDVGRLNTIAVGSCDDGSAELSKMQQQEQPAHFPSTQIADAYRATEERETVGIVEMPTQSITELLGWVVEEQTSDGKAGSDAKIGGKKKNGAHGANAYDNDNTRDQWLADTEDKGENEMSANGKIEKTKMLEMAGFIFARAQDFASKFIFDKAIVLYEEVLQMQRPYGAHYGGSVEVMEAQVVSFMSMHRWDEAASVAASAVAKQSMITGVDSDRVADIKQLQAMVLYGAGKYQKAFALLRDLASARLELCVEFNADGDKKMFAVYILQALTAIKLGYLEAGRACSDRMWAIATKVFASTDFDFIEAFLTRAEILLVSERIQDAKGLAEKALDLLKSSVNEKHPKFVDVFIIFARIASQQGLYKDVDAWLEKAEGMLSKLPHCVDAHFADIWWMRANTLRVRSRLADALSLHQRVLKIRTDVYGDQSAFVVESLVSVSEVLMDYGQYEAADESLLRAQTTLKTLYPPGTKQSTLVAHVAYLRAEVERKTGSLELAAKQYAIASLIYRTCCGENHSLSVKADIGLACLHCDKKEFEVAEKLFRGSWLAIKSIFGTAHVEYAQVINSLGNCFRQMEKSGDASKLISDAIVVYEKIFDGESSLGLVESRNNLALALVEQHAGELKRVYQRARKSGTLSMGCDGFLEITLPDDQRRLWNKSPPVLFNKRPAGLPLQAQVIGPVGGAISRHDDLDRDDDGMPVYPITEFTEASSFLAAALDSLASIVGVHKEKHPMRINIEGNIAVARKVEFESRQLFFALLPDADRSVAKARERQNRDNDSGPIDDMFKYPGLSEMDATVESLVIDCGLKRDHPWFFKFEVHRDVEIKSLVNHSNESISLFTRAEGLRRESHFAEAEGLYNEVLIAQVDHLGQVAASSSVAVASTIFGKAECARALGAITESGRLYLQSMDVCCTAAATENELTAQIFFGYAEGLRCKGLLTSALEFHRRAFELRFRLRGGESEGIIGRGYLGLARCLLELGQLEQAARMSEVAVESARAAIKAAKDSRAGKQREEEMAECLLCQGQICAAKGSYQVAFECIESALSTFRQLFGDDHIFTASALAARAEAKFLKGKIFDARKDIGKALWLLVKSLNAQIPNIVDVVEVDNASIAIRSKMLLQVINENTKTYLTGDGATDSNEGEIVINILRAECGHVFPDEHVSERVASDSSVINIDGSGSKRIVAAEYKGMLVPVHPLCVEFMLLRAEICFAIGDFAEARTLSAGAMDLIAALFDLTETDKMSCLLYVKARALSMKVSLVVDVSKNGDLKALRDNFTTVLDRYIQWFPDANFLRADIAAVISSISLELCDFDDCNIRLKEAINAVSSTCSGGGVHVKSADLKFLSAELLRKQGKFAEAKAEYESGLDIIRTATGESHSMVAKLLHGRAKNLLMLGDLSGANACIEHTLALRVAILGEQHPDVLKATLTSVEISRALGRRWGCREKAQHVLDGLGNCLGEGHRCTARGLLCVGRCLADEGRYLDAIEMYEKALGVIRDSFGDEHSSEADVLEAIGEGHKALGALAVATDFHNRALAIRRKLFYNDEQNIAVVRSLVFIDDIKVLQGDFEAAIKGLESSLATQRAVLGSMHVTVAVTMITLARAYFGQGKLFEAKGYCERGISMLGSFVDLDSHPSVLEAKLWRSRILFASGLAKEASIEGQSCLKNARTYFGGSAHPLLASAIYDMAMIFNSFAFFEKAQLLLKESYHMRIALFAHANADHFDIAESLGGIACNIRDRGIFRCPELSSAKESSHAGATSSSLLEKEPNTKQSFHATSPPVGRCLPDSRPIADVVIDSDEGALSLPLFGRALDMLGRCFQPDNPRILKLKALYGHMLSILGNYNESDATLRTVLKHSRRVLGDEHPDTVQLYIFLSGNLRATSRLYAPNDPEAKLIVSDADIWESSQKGRPTLDDQLSANRKVAEDPPSKVKTDAKTSSPTKKEISPAATATSSIAEVARSKPEKVKKGHTPVYQLSVNAVPGLKVVGVARPKPLKLSDCMWILSTALKVQSTVFKNAPHPSTAMLLFGKGELLRARRRVHDARPVLMEALEMHRKLFGDMHPTVAGCMYALGELCRAENKAAAAYALFQKALEIYQLVYNGRDHPATADTLGAMASALSAQGFYDEAKALFYKAIHVRERCMGKEHPTAAPSLNNLGGLLHILGQLEEAEPLFSLCLQIRQKHLGNKHPDVAMAMNNLGLLYKSMTRFEESRQLHLKALDIQKVALGPDHPDVAVSLNNLAAIYAATNKRSMARQMYNEAIAIKRKVLGNKHPSLASSMNNLAGLLVAMEEMEEAKDLYDESLKIRRDAYGENHPSVAESINNIGLLLYQLREYTESRTQLEHSISIKEKLFGPDHLNVALSMHNLALLLHNIGELDDADQLYSKALAIRQTRLPPDHPDLLATKKNFEILRSSISRRNNEGMYPPPVPQQSQQSPPSQEEEDRLLGIVADDGDSSVLSGFG